MSLDVRLLAGTRWAEGRVTVLDVNTGDKGGAWRAHAGHVDGVAFSPTGSALATVGSDGPVRSWDLAGQRQRAELRHEGRAGYLAFSPDGLTLATTGAQDPRVNLWDVSFLRALEPRRKSK